MEKLEYLLQKMAWDIIYNKVSGNFKKFNDFEKLWLRDETFSIPEKFAKSEANHVYVVFIDQQIFHVFTMKTLTTKKTGTSQ